MAVIGSCIPITLFQQFQDALELLVTFPQHRGEGLGQFGVLPDALTLCGLGLVWVFPITGEIGSVR